MNEHKLLLLGLLRQQGMHGYQLNEFIDNNLSLCADLKKPTAYYLLHQMSAEGWVAAETAQEGNRPPRRVYRLTARGEQAFQELLRQSLAQYQPVNFPGDMALAFLDSLPAGEALGLLEKQREHLQARLERLRAVPAHRGSLSLVFAHQIRHLQAELDWLNDLIQQLQEAQ